ncbi:hypothetical protein HOG48_06465 [Candidatus Peregrinibacteria bacterium]|jgi:hypothetical protein|nr:hypothetical protein [Candidatus Peregrinibacteria bacterium]
MAPSTSESLNTPHDDPRLILDYYSREAIRGLAIRIDGKLLEVEDDADHWFADVRGQVIEAVRAGEEVTFVPEGMDEAADRNSRTLLPSCEMSDENAEAEVIALLLAKAFSVEDEVREPGKVEAGSDTTDRRDPDRRTDTRLSVKPVRVAVGGVVLDEVVSGKYELEGDELPSCEVVLDRLNKLGKKHSVLRESLPIAFPELFAGSGNLDRLKAMINKILFGNAAQVATTEDGAALPDTVSFPAMSFDDDKPGSTGGAHFRAEEDEDVGSELDGDFELPDFVEPSSGPYRSGQDLTGVIEDDEGDEDGTETVRNEE